MNTARTSYAGVVARARSLTHVSALAHVLGSALAWTRRDGRSSVDR